MCIILGIYNIYCDESCHLEHDNSDIMVLGAIMCNYGDVRKISKDIRTIKIKHNLNKNYEIKWTKVSKNKLGFYKELIDYFFNNNSLRFRAVVAKGKKDLNNDLYNQTYDEWYYKMYYLLLNKMLDPLTHYNIYMDIKDTNGGHKVKKLKNILNNYLYTFSQECVRKLQLVTSNESELLQLSDLFIGAIGFKNRFLSYDGGNVDNVPSNGKTQICNYIAEQYNLTLLRKTPISETKFNLFVWEPRKNNNG